MKLIFTQIKGKISRLVNFKIKGGHCLPALLPVLITFSLPVEVLPGFPEQIFRIS